MIIKVSADYYNSQKETLVNSDNIDYISEEDSSKWNSKITFKEGNTLLVREWPHELERLLNER
ncbi:MAG: hypothetical protein ACRDA3_02255 [Peptostreptococcaceae bacterium]